MIKAGEFDVVFKHLDENGDGKVSPVELSRRLGQFGMELCIEEAEMVVGLWDSDGDGLLGAEDIVGLLQAGEKKKLRELREAFGMYDADNCGYITPKNLKKMLSKLGESKSITECKVMINQFDLDGDGALSFEEFRIMM
ncbi:hypothetical protein K2173_012878 [Erythroxylum novogranatense]|uniref:EF-hand domain-containing protein n=1 Tax=Erythroxylum novogranatense TaxID=1862640 RepID=A0AAV8S7L3_9ROSI|nr:hypothetical protein K2173_012878 [Erythroxylum novogranatense]